MLTGVEVDIQGYSCHWAAIFPEGRSDMNIPRCPPKHKLIFGLLNPVTIYSFQVCCVNFNVSGILGFSEIP